MEKAQQEFEPDNQLELFGLPAADNKKDVEDYHARLKTLIKDSGIGAVWADDNNERELCQEK